MSSSKSCTNCTLWYGAAAGAALIAAYAFFRCQKRTKTPAHPHDLVRRTWAMVSGDLQGAGDLFYKTLFQLGPDLPKTLFKQVDMKAQAVKTMQMVDGAVALLDKPGELVPILNTLGERHVSYGTEDAHYPVVGQALIMTLKAALGPAFTPEVEAAWLAVYGVIQTQMIKGAHTAKGEQLRAAYIKRQLAGVTDPHELVRRTWSFIAGDLQGAGDLFYKTLFELGPDLPKTLFKHVDMKAQAVKTMQMVGGAVSLLEKPAELVPVLNTLGERHVSYGTEDAHYPVVGQALILTLKAALGSNFTPEVQAAWLAVYGVVQEQMIKGAHTPKGEQLRKQYLARQSK